MAAAAATGGIFTKETLMFVLLGLGILALYEFVIQPKLAKQVNKD